MTLKTSVLNTLDNSSDGGNKFFMCLNDIYSYLINCRLNVFRGENETWVIAMEHVGFNVRAANIYLTIYYYGNCLINLENHNGYKSNFYSIPLIDVKSVEETFDFDVINPATESWQIRGTKIQLEHSKEAYQEAGIELNENEPGTIGIEQAARWVAEKNKNIFNATDEELYKSIPQKLNKILVLDEWYHRDFRQIFGEHYKEENKIEWDNNRPSTYETWQLIADVIEKNDPTLYKPTLEPNTHWINYPESGTF